MMMDNKIQMETIFGDGSEQNQDLWPKMLVKSTYRRKPIHDRFINQDNVKGRCAAPYPGKIL
jgi:hypothetical protein